MSPRGGLAGLAVFAAGVVAGIAAEELLYRRTFGGVDPEAGEPLGALRGEPIEVLARDGTRLHAEAFGADDGPGIVLCHGFTLRLDSWHYQIRDLVRDGRWRVVAYDARGHGRSGVVGPNGLAPSVLAEDLEAVLHQTGVRPAVVAGHSMGGIMVQALGRFGARFPEEVGEHVRGVVLLNTTFTSAMGAWRDGRVRSSRLRDRLLVVGDGISARAEALERFRFPASDLAMLLTRLGFGATASPAHVAFTRRMIDATPTSTFASGIGGMMNFDLHAGLEKLDVPVLIIAGTRDLLTPAFLSREMAARIPEAELVELENVGHMAMLEQHEEVSGLIRSFAERVLT